MPPDATPWDLGPVAQTEPSLWLGWDLRPPTVTWLRTPSQLGQRSVVGLLQESAAPTRSPRSECTGHLGGSGCQGKQAQVGTGLTQVLRAWPHSHPDLPGCPLSQREQPQPWGGGAACVLGTRATWGFPGLDLGGDPEREEGTPESPGWRAARQRPSSRPSPTGPCL